MHIKTYGKRLSRLAFGAVLALGMLLSNGLQVHAETAQAAQAAAPQISPWSIKVLNEGEKYGIYPLNWYYDGTFQQPITKAKFTALMDATGAKLDNLGFHKKNTTLTYKTDKVITRESVITSVYQLMTNYDLPQSFDLKTATPVDYMKKAGIVKGTNAGLELDNPSTAEQAAVIASRAVEFVYDTADAGAKGLMWKVTNGSNTLYLLGSIHLGSPEMYPLQKHIRDAYEAADDLWVEANIVSGDMTYLNKQMVYADGTTLKDHVSAETYEKLQTVLKKANLPANMFDSYKPISIVLTLSNIGQFSSQEEQALAAVSGVDYYFITKALIGNKPVHELEGIQLQADVLMNVSADEQEKQLKELLDAALNGVKSDNQVNPLKQMQQDWVQGDLQGLAQIAEQDGEFGKGGANERLIGERDDNMAKKLIDLLEQPGKHTSFVIVGSAHYVTKGMVVDQLKDKGYNVEFIQ